MPLSLSRHTRAASNGNYIALHQSFGAFKKILSVIPAYYRHELVYLGAIVVQK